MSGAPQLEERSRPGIGQRVLLQLHERRARAVIRLRDLEREAIRFMLEVTGETASCAGAITSENTLVTSSSNGSDATSARSENPNRFSPARHNRAHRLVGRVEQGEDQSAT